MSKRVSSLIELGVGIVIVVSCIVILINYLPTTGIVKGEFVAYSDLREMGLWLLGLGIVAGWALCSGIRGLLQG